MSFSRVFLRSICFDIAADKCRNLAPNRRSRLMAMGQAIKTLCAQFSTHAMLKPKAKKVNTPDSTVDMNPAITKEVTSWGKRSDFFISHLQLLWQARPSLLATDQRFQGQKSHHAQHQTRRKSWERIQRLAGRRRKMGPKPLPRSRPMMRHPYCKSNVPTQAYQTNGRFVCTAIIQITQVLR